VSRGAIWTHAIEQARLRVVARPRRDKTPGLHHVTVGATGTELYYVDDVDRAAWTRRLIAMLGRYRWTCILMCQLSTHVHLIVDVPDESLPDGMHFLNFAYSRRFNERHSRRGCLLRSRYWSKRIHTDDQLHDNFCYVARNPVEAGLCARAEDWRWSSFADACGLADRFPFTDASRVSDCFGDGFAGRQALLDYVASRG
jgi:putative transposase